MLGADHGLGTDVVGRDRQFRRALRPHHRRPRRAHLHELGLAAFVARATGRDAAEQPVLFEAQLGVEPLGIARFLGINGFGPRIEPAEADFLAADAAAVEPQRRFRQPRQERAVVADRDERTRKAAEPVLDPFDCREVEMVGRFVEQQDVGLHRESARDGGAAPLAARSGRRFARQVDPDLIGNRFYLMRRDATRGRVIAQRRKSGQRRFLLEQDDACAGHDGAPSFVGVDLPRQKLEQRRLSGAVPTDQRQPVAWPHEQVEPAEQPAAPLDNAEIFICENGCSHH